MTIPNECAPRSTRALLHIGVWMITPVESKFSRLWIEKTSRKETSLRLVVERCRVEDGKKGEIGRLVFAKMEETFWLC